MAGDLLETYLLRLIEAHAHASGADRVRIRPGPRTMPRPVRAVSAAVIPGGRADRRIVAQTCTDTGGILIELAINAATASERQPSTR
jgi:hypothetical protein